MQSERMRELLLHSNFKVISENKSKGPNQLKAIISDVGDL